MNGRVARVGVLMVTGAYYPEVSGAGLQCRSLISRLRGDVDFTVLTTTTDRTLPAHDDQDGVNVFRVFVNPRSVWSLTAATVRMIRTFFRLRRQVSIVHFHGFSRKSMLLVGLALATQKPIAIKLTSFGHDDPLSMRARSRVRYWCYRRAAIFFAVSSRFRESYAAAGLPPQRLRLIPNGVDLDRFHPADPRAREALRAELSIPAGAPVVLFVGFFSTDKRPDLLYSAWQKVARSSFSRSVLVFVGATRSPYYEINRDLAEWIQRRAAESGLGQRMLFVELTHEIERFHRAADIFVLPSIREGLPNALLEAMASGTACVAARLAGVTDDVIEHGRNGLLVPPDDEAELEQALRQLSNDPAGAMRLGCEARRTIEMRYGLDQVARQYLEAYRDLAPNVAAAAGMS